MEKVGDRRSGEEEEVERGGKKLDDENWGKIEREGMKDNGREDD